MMNGELAKLFADVNRRHADAVAWMGELFARQEQLREEIAEHQRVLSDLACQRESIQRVASMLKRADTPNPAAGREEQR